MWLAPFRSHVADAALRVYYRLHRAGGAVREPARYCWSRITQFPPDPAMSRLPRVGSAIPGKAPLFTDPLVGFLVRGAGSIPFTGSPTIRLRLDVTRRCFAPYTKRWQVVRQSGSFRRG